MASRKKSPRRKPGTGAIRYKDGRTLPWEAAFPIGHRRWRYDYFATWAEATAHLDTLTEERDNEGQARNIAGGSQRVDTFLVAWLTMKRTHIKEKTFTSYHYLCNLAVAEFGTLRLDDVTREKADGLIAYFHRRNFKGVGQLRAVLRQAFEYALEESYIKRNPFQKVKTPQIEHRTGQVLSETQREILLNAATIEDDPTVPLCPIWHLYARLGLRRGEAMGLRRTDIDFHAKTITISQQYTSIRGKTVLSTPKTKRSRRTLPCPDDILTLLRAQLDEQIKRAATDPHWVVTGLVFTDAHGEHLTVGKIYWRWQVLRKRASLPDTMVLHDLRHTALTRLELSGAPLNVVQAIAGHTSATMTGHYTAHVGVEDMRRVIGR